MKIIKKILSIILLISLCLIAFSACNLDFSKIIKETIDKSVWSYSDNGEQEINLNFEAIDGEDYKGVNEWKIVKSDKTYNLTIYTDKSGDTDKYKYMFKKDNITLTVIKIGTAYYYINEANKTVTSTITTEFNEFATEFLNIPKYTVIRLKNEEDTRQWSFIKKTDSVSIKNIDNADEDSVQYEYLCSERSSFDDGTKMFVNFKKVITPVINRIYYEFYDGTTLTSTLTIYMPLHTSDTVTDADFTIPTTEDGYTVS